MFLVMLEYVGGGEDMMIELITRVWQSYINREHDERMLKLDSRLAVMEREVVSRVGSCMTEKDLDELRCELRNAVFLK